MPQEFISSRRSALSRRLKVGVLCGGASSERNISLKSGRAVYRAFRKMGFRARRIDTRDPGSLAGALGKIDVAFVALHGHGGEDGAIQRRLECSRIPYVGSAAGACHRSFHKDIAKRRFLAHGLPTPRYDILRPSDWTRRLRNFPTPFFIKPCDDGSSIGVFCVEDLTKSAEKIKQALDHYGRLLVEKKIEGREFTVGVLGRRALPVIEIRPKRPFYDYRAKYTKGMTTYEVPARIPREWTSRLKRLALRAHRVLGLRDFSRADMMVDRAGRAYLLEVNAIPGLTELSLLPKAARAAGISFESCCRRLTEWAYRRGRNGKV